MVSGPLGTFASVACAAAATPAARGAGAVACRGKPPRPRNSAPPTSAASASTHIHPRRRGRRCPRCCVPCTRVGPSTPRAVRRAPLASPAAPQRARGRDQLAQVQPVLAGNAQELDADLVAAAVALRQLVDGAAVGGDHPSGERDRHLHQRQVADVVRAREAAAALADGAGARKPLRPALLQHLDEQRVLDAQPRVAAFPEVTLDHGSPILTDRSRSCRSGAPPGADTRA